VIVRLVEIGVIVDHHGLNFLFLKYNFVLGPIHKIHGLRMFGSSLPPVVCRRSHVLFTLFVFVCL
jgi:hypothetical protein